MLLEMLLRWRMRSLTGKKKKKKKIQQGFFSPKANSCS